MVENNEIFVGSGASITFVPENDIYIKQSGAITDSATITLHGDMAHFSLVDDLYVACAVEHYNTSDVLQDTLRVKSNTATTLVLTKNITSSANDYFILKGYGAPCPAPKSAVTPYPLRLLSDEWLGLVNTATFPSSTIEMKEQNLFLGGSRNFTFAYKGIETSDGGSLDITANHGAWLYYALGLCSSISATALTTTGAGSNHATTAFSAAAASAGKYIYDDGDGHITNGPLFYRVITDGSDYQICPPLLPTDAFATIDLLTIPTSTNLIEYTFTEANSASLPSFALERTFSKLNSSNTYAIEGETPETHNFVTIARGNRVNSLTISANENEEVKMAVELNTRAITSIPSTINYEARRGVTDETAFANYNRNNSFLEPFFFYDGSISMFSQEFLKITSLTLAINNNIVDKRYIGVSSREVKEGIPAQRFYEMTFTAQVTDDTLFTEFRNLTEEKATGTDPNKVGLIELTFSKSNGEQIVIKLDDYYVTANNWTIPEDLGAIDVEATIKARTLNSCTVKTHWVLQG
jgi:hypothetical protein